MTIGHKDKQRICINYCIPSIEYLQPNWAESWIQRLYDQSALLLEQLHH